MVDSLFLPEADELARHKNHSSIIKSLYGLREEANLGAPTMDLCNALPKVTSTSAIGQVTFHLWLGLRDLSSAIQKPLLSAEVRHISGVPWG